MSHASGRLLIPVTGEILGWFEYNGTSDLCQPKVFATQDELRENWRTRDWPMCLCVPIRQDPVDLENHYTATTARGGWCPVCRVITLDPFAQDLLTPFYSPW